MTRGRLYHYLVCYGIFEDESHRFIHRLAFFCSIPIHLYLNELTADLDLDCGFSAHGWTSPRSTILLSLAIEMGRGLASPSAESTHKALPSISSLRCGLKFPSAVVRNSLFCQGRLFVVWAERVPLLASLMPDATS